MVVPQNLDRVIGHQAIPQLCSPCTHVSLNTLLCIGNCLLICDDNTMDMVIHVLPQVHCRFHIDEAGVFAELPVRVVGDPPFPVMGVNHFPGRTDRDMTVLTEKLGGYYLGVRCLNDASPFYTYKLVKPNEH